MRNRLGLITIALLATTPARADRLVEPSSEATFDKSPSFAGKPFLCLGTGLRKYALFKIYAIDFCLDAARARPEIDAWFAGPGKRLAALRGAELARALEKAQDFFDYLAGSEADKRVELVFLRSAEAEKVRAGFTKNLEKALGPTAAPAIAAFASAIDRDVRIWDRLVFVTHPSGALVLGWGGRVEVLRHEKAPWAFWSAYLGEDSVVPSLKESVARGVAELRR
jgi:hypothetical protein